MTSPIQNGVPSLNRDMEDFYERKLGTSYAEVGRETMTEFGKAVSAEVYAHLPERSSELQT